MAVRRARRAPCVLVGSHARNPARSLDRGGLPPGDRRHAQCRPETRPGPPPSAHRPPSTLFSEERRPSGSAGSSGAAPSGRSPGSRRGALAAPRWRLSRPHSPSHLPAGRTSPQWRPTEDVEPARFLGPLPFTVAGPRRTLTGFPVGPDMGTRGQAVCGTPGGRGASGWWSEAGFCVDPGSLRHRR